jgi:serine/threonine-protein kinase
VAATLPAAAGSQPGGSQPGGAGEIASYQTHAGQLLGTPLYMAPEQIEGGSPDERSEVFSVGVLAYEILAGRPPYSAATMDALFLQITRDAPPPLEDVPGAVNALVMRALEKDPARRFPTMSALAGAVAAERKRRFAPRARRGRATTTSSARSRSTTSSTPTRRRPCSAPRWRSRRITRARPRT